MQDEPIPLHDGLVDTSHLISYKTISTAEPLCTMEVNPLDQKRCLLGDYAANARLKGFSVEFAPDSDPGDAVATHITNYEVGKKYRLHLHVANFGDKTITAIVRQL